MSATLASWSESDLTTVTRIPPAIRGRTPKNRDDTITFTGDRYVQTVDGKVIAAGSLSVTPRRVPGRTEYDASDRQFLLVNFASRTMLGAFFANGQRRHSRSSPGVSRACRLGARAEANLKAVKVATVLFVAAGALQSTGCEWKRIDHIDPSCNKLRYRLKKVQAGCGAFYPG